MVRMIMQLVLCEAKEILDLNLQGEVGHTMMKTICSQCLLHCVIKNYHKSSCRCMACNEMMWPGSERFWSLS